MTTNANPSSQLLAVEGGQPIRTGSMSPWPFFDEEFIEA
jgi:hypothetical protein